MFWMKNHSSAYFILLPWPILGKFIILDYLLRQNSLPHITVFTINSTESKEWMNLSLHASLWTLHRLRLAQTLTPLLPRRLWNIGSIYYFASKLAPREKGERVASGPILFAASLNISQLCIDGIAQQQVRMWNIPVSILKLTFSNLITNSVCVKEIRNINYAIPFLYLNYGQRMPDLCNLHAYLMFQVRPRSEGEFLGLIEENLTHPPEPSRTKMCWLNKPKYHILSSQKILSPEKSGSL